MTTTAPTPLELLARSLDRSLIEEMLDLSADLLAEEEIDELTEHSLRQRIREIADREQRRRDRLIQMEFDLRAAGHEPIAECQSPPRWWIPDYVDWLRAGGGRGYSALCGPHCTACGGVGPAWLRVSA